MEYHINNIISSACYQSQLFLLKATQLLWNSKDQILCVTNGGGALKRKILIHRLLVVVLIFGGATKLENSTRQKQANTVELILYALAVSCSVCFHTFVVSLKFKSASICLYVNNLIQLRKAFPGPFKFMQLSALEKTNLYLAYVFNISFALVPVLFVYGVHWSNFCAPSLLLSFAVPSCQRTQASDAGYFAWTENIARIFVFVINHWFWAFGFHVGGMAVSVVMILCPLIFGQYLKRYQLFFTKHLEVL